MGKLTKNVNGVDIELTDEEEAEVRAQWAASDLEAKKTQYIRDRAVNYPSINDQLDHLFHNGFDSWKKMIQGVKDKYPKP